MAQILMTTEVLPENFLDEVWELLVQVNDDSSRDELLAAVDQATDKFHEIDAERFPLAEDGDE